MKLYILHSLPDAAAQSLAERDVKKTLNHCIFRLGWSWTGKHLADPLVRWIRYSRANYYWMCRFCEVLQQRSSLRHYELIKSLKLSYPPAIFRGFFERNNAVPVTYSWEASSRRVCDNRLSYYRARQKNAKWTTAPKPGWFTRLQVLYSNARTDGAILRCLTTGLVSPKRPRGRTSKRSLRPAGANTVRYNGIVVQYH